MVHLVLSDIKNTQSLVKRQLKRSQFLIKHVQTFPSHLNHVVTLPWEMQISENNTYYAKITITMTQCKVTDITYVIRITA